MNPEADQQTLTREFEPDQDELHRGLQSRHLVMIAIGGAIGTGLFVASGETISEAGPGGAVLAYGLIGIMVYFLVQSIGEMAAYLPVSGSLGEFAHRYVSPSLGFAAGWNYWFGWAITVAAEVLAATIVIKFWFPNSPTALWSTLFLSALVGLNALSSRVFGESEFWFAAIKVVAIVVFLTIGLLMIIGVMGGRSPGFSNWTTGEAPFVNGAGGAFSVFLIAGFSFQGTEFVGTAAGEVKNPEQAVPKAAKSIFWRILLFYIGAIIVIGFLLPYTDPSLLKADIDNVAVSPFTLVFERAGIAGAAAVMNAVILTSVLSAGNSGLYAATRMLYRLAAQGNAPKVLLVKTKKKIPVVALGATTAVGALAYLSSFVGDGIAYTWLVTASGLSGFITWMGVAYSHIRFRQGLKAQGVALSSLPYRAKFFPLGAIVAFSMCALVIIGQSWLLIKDQADLGLFIASYGLIPVFLILWGGYKLVRKPQKTTPRSMDLHRDH